MANQTDYRYGPWYDNYGGFPIITMTAHSAITKGQVLQLSTGTYSRGVKPYDGDAGVTAMPIGVALAPQATAGEEVPVVPYGPVMLIPCGAAGATAGQIAVMSETASEDGEIVSKAADDGTNIEAVIGLCLTTGDEAGELVAVMLCNQIGHWA